MRPCPRLRSAQKPGGTSLTCHYLKQFTVVPPPCYTPADPMDPDDPSETFLVLEEAELRAHSEFRTRRLVLEAWSQLATGISIC